MELTTIHLIRTIIAVAVIVAHVMQLDALSTVPTLKLVFRAFQRCCKTCHMATP